MDAARQYENALLDKFEILRPGFTRFRCVVSWVVACCVVGL